MALPGPLTNIIIMPHLVRKKLNNHFIISQKMIDRGMIKDFEILEDGANIQFPLFISFQNFWLQCVSGRLNRGKLLCSATSELEKVVKVSNFKITEMAKPLKVVKVSEISNISKIGKVVKITNFNAKNVFCHFVSVKEEWYPNFFLVLSLSTLKVSFMEKW